MMFGHPQLSYRQCTECGIAVAASELDDHECDPERRIEFQMLKLRPGILALDVEVAAFLASPRGRFEQWYAERERLRAPV